MIQNALLHAFDGERAGTMRLSARRLDPAMIELRFEDDGHGVAADALSHIFEPFYTTKRGHGGTGLGLHIVFNLVTAKLGGRIDVHGAPEDGLHFLLRIPVVAPT